MSVGKAAALTAGFVGAMALGVAIGPAVHDKWSDERATAPAAATASAPAEASSAPKSPARTTRRVARPAHEVRPSAAVRNRTDTLETVPVATWPSELRGRARNVLNRGAKLELAAADFSNAEDFMTVAHAARNTKVPFAVLKHHVLENGRTLADVIHEFKPELDAKAEVTRARAAAREDLNLAG